MAGTLSIIGAGRVGRALGRRLRELGWKIGAVVTQHRAQRAQSGAFHRCGARACVSDASGACCAGHPDYHAGPRRTRMLPRSWRASARKNCAVKSCSTRAERLSSDVLDPVRRCGAAVGSMHPLQTFSGVGVPPLDGRVFAIEGDTAAVRMARQIARALGAVPVHIEGSKKPLYHAAGALAAGNVLALMEAATRLMTAAGMKRREASAGAAAADTAGAGKL